MRAASQAIRRTELRPEAPSDADCVRAILAGDPEAFGTLVERYQHEYMRFAVRVLGTREEADEALQAAFVRAYRALAQCRDAGRFGAWLYRIVVNECRTRATRRGRRARWFVRDEAALEQAPAADTGDQAAVREEIQRALDRLPTEQREAFVLKYVEELSYEEMAEITGASVSALKMRAGRACRRLRGLLEGVFDA
jgi:RNA polymerase sigma-70 factor (ECF subfamily)